MHQLQLIRGTRMALEYRQHPEDFHLFDVEEYIGLVIDYIDVYKRQLERGEVGGLSGKKRERVGGNIFLVKADESQHLAVGTEFQRTVEGELLFVNPVGDAVQHLVLFSVFRHLAFACLLYTSYEPSRHGYLREGTG